MRTNLQAAFRRLLDVREVADPWGLGSVWLIRRDGSEAVEAVREAAMRDDPGFEPTVRCAARAAFLQRMGAPRERIDKEIEAAIDAAAPGVDMTARQREFELRLSVARVGGWRGLTGENGEAVPFSEEELREQLASTELVPPEAPFGGPAGGKGRKLGEALAEWLAYESKAQEAFAVENVREELGNSGGLSSSSS
ncbi:MAG: hypothetical protein IPQ07_39980 [Myxococcales bacterium]|nr:hypothetical protein [Myxococcales bacterium]